MPPASIPRKVEDVIFYYSKPVTTHVVPRSAGVQRGMHNIVYACQGCAASKGERDFVEWWSSGLRKPRDTLPRVPLGLYLKIAYELHKINFTLRRPCQSLEELSTLLAQHSK